MTTSTGRHPLHELHRALRDADVVLMPVDASQPDPFPGSATDILHALCASPAARTMLERAASRWTHATEGVFELRDGFIAMPLPLTRSAAGGRFAALTVLAEALPSETIEQLAHSARIDARIARSIVGAAAPWTRSACERLARMVASLARSENERLAGADAGARLGAAWEELHLLHSLAGDMRLGASPSAFVAHALTELRATLGCSWTALRVEPGAADQLLAMPGGGMLCDGIAAAAAARVLEGLATPARAHIAANDLVLAPVRREDCVIGMLAAGGLAGDAAAMSNWERTLVETAAGHLSVFLDNARLYRDLDAMFMGALSAIVSAIDAKDPYTRGHSQRVALLSRQIGEAAGLPEGELKRLHIAGLVHDVGKIGMPEAILRKQDRLTDEEFAIVRQHPEIGWRILRDIPQFAPVLDGVRHHHERIDGRGYPHGLKGDAIPLFARVIAIADTFDAMSSTRTYRAAKPRALVLTEMNSVAGTQLDAALLAAFRTIDLRSYDALNTVHAGDMAREAA